MNSASIRIKEIGKPELKQSLAPVQLGAVVIPELTPLNFFFFWVVANFKETQLKSLKEGGEANLIVDGFPDQKITGRIASLSEATGSRFALLPPDNATGNFVKVTQRVPVKIAIENFSEYKNMLRAGMSVTVEVKK